VSGAEPGQRVPAERELQAISLCMSMFADVGTVGLEPAPLAYPGDVVWIVGGARVHRGVVDSGQDADPVTVLYVTLEAIQQSRLHAGLQEQKLSLPAVTAAARNGRASVEGPRLGSASPDAK
jgi:hypothetical protein